jgi:hypothetical protein
MMMPEVVLVNTSRGEIVHIPSLVEALGEFLYSFQSVHCTVLVVLKGQSNIVFTIVFCNLIAPHYSEPISVFNLRRSLNAKSRKIASVT